MPNTSTQASKLLPTLFQRFDAEQVVTVFHVGLALPETVDFFSNFRCKLHFIDVFAALPIVTAEETAPTLEQQFKRLLKFPADTLFDVCLFWDVFNFLDEEAIKAFLTLLQPHLKKSCMAHAFTVHNRKTPQEDHFYGIQQVDMLSVRSRQAKPPGYAPHSQRKLTAMLDCFRVERSVLLPDSRLELLLIRS